MAKLLLINPNTSTATTSDMLAVAVEAAAGRIEIEAATAERGPQKIVVDDAPIYFINVATFVTASKRTLDGISDSIWGVTADPMDQMGWSA